MTCFFLKSDYMIIGFIGFGRVSKSIVKMIESDKIKFITSGENRSHKTILNIKKVNVECLDTFREVALTSDILICATSPANALNNAEKYGKYCKGIYLDVNNISPDTTFKINELVPDLVDGAIIGNVGANPVMYVSGKNADKLSFLKDYMSIRKISDNIGDASLLKLLRSTYTKSLTALLIETTALANKYNLKEDFFDVVSLTEGEDFPYKSLSRVENTLKNPQRKAEELLEIIEYFGNDLKMPEAALKILKQY